MRLGGRDRRRPEGQGPPPLACNPTGSTRWCGDALPARPGAAIWLPDPRVREERELARFRIHLVKHRSAQAPVHSTLINFGRPVRHRSVRGRGAKAAGATRVPEPWRENVTASFELIDDSRTDHRDQRAGSARPRRPPLHPVLMSVPGIGWVLALRSPPRSARSPRSRARKARRLLRPLPAHQPVGDKDRRGR